jgi:hypothetical protein
MESDEGAKLWERAARLLILRTSEPPPEGHSHLAEDELWMLAGYDGGPQSGEERDAWGRALGCSDCYNRLAQLRHMISNPDAYGIAESSPPIEDLWRAWQSRTRIRIELTWLTAVIAAAARRRGRSRSIRTRGTGAAEAPAAPPLVSRFADFEVEVTADSAPDDRCTLVVRVDPRIAGASTDALVARLYKDAELIEEKRFGGEREVVFPGLERAAWEIEIARNA